MTGAELPPLFGRLPDELNQVYEAEAPWTLLGAGLEQILAALPSAAVEIRVSPDVHLAGDRIAIGAGTIIHPGVVIEGPVRIGRQVVIRPGAYVRGGNWIGDGCIVGANTELKRAILLNGARAPHLNYVGDSILGQGVNLGAGTILSNFRHDGAPVAIPLQDSRAQTGRRKLGAILGDGVLTGCNCVLHPGVVIGTGTQLYPGVHLRAGVYPAQRVIKLRQQIQVVERR